MAQKRKQVGGRSEKHLNFITVKSLRWNLFQKTHVPAIWALTGHSTDPIWVRSG